MPSSNLPPPTGFGWLRRALSHERTVVAALVAPMLWVTFPSASMESLAESKLRVGAWVACALALAAVTLHRPFRRKAAAPAEPPPSSERDSATGLPHRHAFDSQLEILSRNVRPEANEIGLLFLGVDRIEDLELAHGRTAREEAMRRTARILLEEMRPGNSCALWSESEFVASFPGITRERLANLAEKLRRRVQAEFQGSKHKATASIGIAFGATPQALSLTGQAQQALRRAREGGGDRTELAAKDPAG